MWPVAVITWDVERMNDGKRKMTQKVPLKLLGRRLMPLQSRLHVDRQPGWVLQLHLFKGQVSASYYELSPHWLDANLEWTFFLLTFLPWFCRRNVAMTMWAFAKFLLQSRWTRLFWFLLPTIWLGGYGSKLLAASTWRIVMLNMTTEYLGSLWKAYWWSIAMLWSGFFAVPCCVGDSRLVHAGSRAFLFLATSPATIKDQSQDRYNQRIANLKIYFRNVGLVYSNCKSTTNICKHVLSVMATSNHIHIVQVSSACLQWPRRCGGWKV